MLLAIYIRHYRCFEENNFKTHNYMTTQTISKEVISFENKSFPEYLKKEAKLALSFYPELVDTPIEFRLTKKMSTSVMKAQPKFLSLFKSRRQRQYVILISRSFGIHNKELNTSYIPVDVMVGWLGHELGHIMDYKNRSSLNLIVFGFKYVFSESFIKSAEQTADNFAVSHGMKHYILETKKFILNHTDLTPKYKEKIKRLYTSPEDVLDFVNQETI